MGRSAGSTFALTTAPFGKRSVVLVSAGSFAPLGSLTRSTVRSVRPPTFWFFTPRTYLAVKSIDWFTAGLRPERAHAIVGRHSDRHSHHLAHLLSSLSLLSSLVRPVAPRSPATGSTFPYVNGRPRAVAAVRAAVAGHRSLAGRSMGQARMGTVRRVAGRRPRSIETVAGGAGLPVAAVAAILIAEAAVVAAAPRSGRGGLRPSPASDYFTSSELARARDFRNAASGCSALRRFAVESGLLVQLALATAARAAPCGEADRVAGGPGRRSRGAIGRAAGLAVLAQVAPLPLRALARPPRPSTSAW